MADYDHKDNVLPPSEKPYTADVSDSNSGNIVTSEHEKLGLWTRMGVTPESFQRRTTTDGQGEVLNKTLKSRHLQMIAIGGSIGAGFFVGSGSALSKGVSYIFQLNSDLQNWHGQGPGAVLVDFLIMGFMIFNVGKLSNNILCEMSWLT